MWAKDQREKDRQSSQEGRTTSNRISSLFNNNLLFNTKPRPMDEVLDEGEETSCDGSYDGLDSPVHNMNEHELIVESYIGYSIGAITVSFLSLLIYGYITSVLIPDCFCYDIETETYKVPKSEWNDTCFPYFIGKKHLTIAEIRECESTFIGPLALKNKELDHTKFDGLGCQMDLVIKKDRQSFFNIVCNDDEAPKDTI